MIPAGIYLLKVNNRNIGTRCEICTKLTIKEMKFICKGKRHVEVALETEDLKLSM